MSIWLVTVFVAVIAALVTALLFTIKGNVKLQKEISMMMVQNHHLEQDTMIQMREIKDLEKQLSFQEGLRLARRTDTLYQQILKRCAGKERFTVMMNGTEKEGEIHE